MTRCATCNAPVDPTLREMGGTDRFVGRLTERRNRHTNAVQDMLEHIVKVLDHDGCVVTLHRHEQRVSFNGDDPKTTVRVEVVFQFQKYPKEKG